MPPVFEVTPAPVVVDELLVRLAAAGRAANVRREHADPPREQVLDVRAVHRLLLRLGPAVDEHRERGPPVTARLVEPRRNLAAVEALIADELWRAQVETGERRLSAFRHRPRVTRRRVDDEDLGRTR